MPRRSVPRRRASPSRVTSAPRNWSTPCWLKGFTAKSRSNDSQGSLLPARQNRASLCGRALGGLLFCADIDGRGAGGGRILREARAAPVGDPVFLLSWSEKTVLGFEARFPQRHR